jgi:hypothetical protein
MKLCKVIAAILFMETVSILGRDLPLDARFIWAIHQVETGGFSGEIYGAHGELGGFQITRACWIDSKVEGEFEQCRSDDYSVKVMGAYLNRYAKKAIESNDFETLARTFNGGPLGPKKEVTKKYWLKVKKQMYESQKHES